MTGSSAAGTVPSGATRRPAELRVLVSAYACGPGDESEASAGWAIACAAAARHRVWLVTRTRFRSAIEDAMSADRRLAGRLTVTYLDLSPEVMRWKRRGFDVYWYYALWQRRLAREARRLHAEVRFDVVHHVTFAADWLPCGATRLGSVPLVWGPVGGATYLPWRMARWVGLRGLVGEVGRSAFTRVCRRLWGDATARRAELVVAQNAEVARRFRQAARVVVEPNAALGAVPTSVRQPGSAAGRAVFVARLVAWKGAGLAISALVQPELREWTLDVYGGGPQGDRLRGLADRLGVGDRVIFHGHTARSHVLDALSQADVLLFPSLHDSAGWAAAEASAMGCPVVCFDHGGPALMAGPNAHVIGMGRTSVPELATAAVRAARTPVTPYTRWSRDRLPDIVDGWYREAASARAD